MSEQLCTLCQRGRARPGAWPSPNDCPECAPKVDPPEYLGCGDGGCIVERARGMHTNGGCRCLRGMKPDRQVALVKAIRRSRDRILELEQQLDTVMRHAR